jgi:hypothetical protein
MAQLRVRNGVNGVEVMDSLSHEWKPMDRGEASRLVSNILFPKGYANPKAKPNHSPKVRVSTLSGVEIRAGKGGR